MKTLVICLLVLFMWSVPLYAETTAPQQQTGEAAAPGGPQMKCPMMQMHGQGTQGGQQMPMMHGGQQMQGMMEMCPKMCPKMGQMMGHGMMARDMMQMMTDMIRMQQKIIRGLSPVEKKEMMKDTDRMLDKMEKMMSDMRGMMMHGMMDQPAPARETEPAEEKPKENVSAPHKH
jgi:hypothetical protein